MTQYNRVLEHLRTKGKLTQKQAINLYGAYRLSAIIYDLRKQGYKIETDFKTSKNRFGDICTYAVYALEKEKRNELDNTYRELN